MSQQQKNKQLAVITLSLMALIVSLFYFKDEIPQPFAQRNKQAAAAKPVLANPIWPNLPQPNDDIRKPAAAPVVPFRMSQKSEDYFRKQMLLVPEVAQLYEVLSKNLSGKNKRVQDLIAIYFAEAIARHNTPEFNQFYGELMRELVSQSDEVLTQLKAQRPLIADHPFVFQSSLNLVAQLNLPVSSRADYIAETLKAPFKIDQKTKDISPESASMTVALILLRQINAPYELVQNHLKAGKKASSKNKDALQEFQVRVKTYYPEHI